MQVIVYLELVLSDDRVRICNTRISYPVPRSPATGSASSFAGISRIDNAGYQFPECLIDSPAGIHIDLLIGKQVNTVTQGF